MKRPQIWNTGQTKRKRSEVGQSSKKLLVEVGLRNRGSRSIGCVVSLPLPCGAVWDRTREDRTPGRVRYRGRNRTEAALLTCSRLPLISRKEKRRQTILELVCRLIPHNKSVDEVLCRQRATTWPHTSQAQAAKMEGWLERLGWRNGGIEGGRQACATSRRWGQFIGGSGLETTISSWINRLQWIWQAEVNIAGVRRSRWRGESRRRRISNRKNESECRLDMQGIWQDNQRSEVGGVDLLAL